jgi:endonuclease V-like protein UPF0215 family
MKNEIRILGIDDSPFTFNDKFVSIVGVIMRGGSYIEGVLREEVSVDGDDATFICKKMIENTRHNKQLKAVLIDGIALGGFNVVNIDELYGSTKIPVITITRDKPDFVMIKKALQKKFNIWEDKWNLITKGELHRIKTKHNPIFIKFVGLSIEESKEIIKLSTIRGVVPEPIRVAHFIASGIKRGESYGKA